jgi:peptidylprolyl isomerase/peptidyl-prolyl cis-trans isomerase B (cyclophilin B)
MRPGIWSTWFAIAATVIMLLPVAISFSPATPASAAALFADTTASADTVPAETEESANPRILFTLEKGGTFVIELRPDQAPLACERILLLVRDGFFDGLKFHRVESYLVQTGKKDHDYPPVEGEMWSQKLRHVPGAAGMARFPNDYDSATTQIYILKEPKANFNGEYTLFGMVVEGYDTVEQIKKGAKIEAVVVVE